MSQLHPFILYSLKAAIALAIIYLFYFVFLCKLTFYRINRYYLLLYSALSFIIPFINIANLLKEKSVENFQYFKQIPSIKNIIYADNSLTNSTITFSKKTYDNWQGQNITLIILISGTIILLLKLIFQFISFYSVKNKSVLLLNDKIKLYDVPQKIIPFSFCKSIFIHSASHTKQEFEEIILHETAHINQKHFVDILFTEFLIAFQWFNPFAWLIKKFIKQNLEFLADENVLQNGADKKHYQLHLLKVSGVSVLSLSNQFNFSSLKKRIFMMNKNKTSRIQLARFAFSLPLIALLLFAFRDKITIENQQTISFLKKGNIVDINNTNNKLNDVQATEKTYPNSITKNKSDAQETINENDTMQYPSFNEFKKSHPEIKFFAMGWKSTKPFNFSVELKNGSQEKYNLTNVLELEKAEKKYGALPLNSPPPMPKLKDEDTTNMPLNYRMFLRNNLQINSAFWRKPPMRIIIGLKNGMYESYELTKPNEVAKAEQKYGTLPAPLFTK